MKAIDALATIGVVHDKQMLSIIDLAMAFGLSIDPVLYPGDSATITYSPKDIVEFMKNNTITNEQLKDGSIKLTVTRKGGA